MRLIGLISWYNERPEWLAAGVASLQKLGVDHVVAVDGAYFLYPEGSRCSPAGQAEAIRETARACDMGCTIHEPASVWIENEVQKRDFMFRLAELASEPEDWYFVLDGDELVTDVGCNVKQRCLETTCDVGEVLLWKAREHYSPSERPFSTEMEERNGIRVMFRAIRGLRVIGNHYTYVTPDGRYLWARDEMEPAEDFRSIRLLHRNKDRDPWRNKQAADYYKRRDDLNIEGLRR